MTSKQNPYYKKLQQTYKKWEDLQSKGQLKMKMKLNNQKLQYYDFDFSRYHYYYNYPSNHFSFLSPDKQKQLFNILINQILQTEVKLFNQTQDYQNYNHNQNNSFTNQCNSNKQISGKSQFFNFKHQYYNKFFSHLKPYQLQHFLHDYITKIKNKIVSLRIKKSLLTPAKVKQHFKNAQKKTQAQSVIELLQTQIRTYLSKLSRVNQFDFQFGKDIATRFEQKKSHLKASDRDQIHFSPIQKSDIIIYERLIKTNNKFLFPIKCVEYESKLLLKFKYAQIERMAYLKSLQSIKSIQNKQKLQFEMRKDKIMKYLTQKQPHFLEQFSNISSIDQFLKSTSYLARLSSASSKGCLNINIYYEDVEYIPQNNQQLNHFVKKVCLNHFSPSLLQSIIEPQNKQNYSQEHLCYKIQKLASTIFRISQQTFDLTVKYQDRDLFTKKVTMRRELQTVFSKDIDKLLNVPEHQSILIVENQHQLSYKIEELQNKIKFQLQQKQLIYEKYFKSYQFRDPFLASFANLLFSRKQKNFHDIIDEYTKYLNQKQIYTKKLPYLMLFYENIHSDPKNHLINVMNKKLSLAKQTNLNPNFTKFLTILQNNSRPGDKVSIKLLNSLYLLRLVTTYLNKNKLMNILNGQVNIMLKLKNKINFLKRKSRLKFELSKQFITRYTQTNEKKQDAFDFLRQIQTVDDKVSYQIPSDRLFIDAQNNDVYVKRTNPQNPLFEGKKIIYEQSIKQVQQSIQRMIRLGSKMIQKRQNYLYGQELTQIVDRVQLLYTIMDCEVKYQMNKLCLMNQYSQILQKSISPQGIQYISYKIYKLKMEQFSISLNQNNFTQQYNHLITNIKHKTNILQHLKSMLLKIQRNQQIQIHNGLIKNNFNLHSPQISSIYYSQGTKNQQQIQEQQSDADDSQINVLVNNAIHNDSDSKSQILPLSALQISQFSGTHKSYKHSDYHVKKSFKQILGLNQTSKIKSNIQKKEQMLNRKKKRVFNDTILGKLLHYSYDQKQKKPYIQHSQHLHIVQIVMNSIDDSFKNDLKYKNISIQNIALEEIIKQVCVFESKQIRHQNKLSEQLLPFSLHECSKTLSRLVQKIKSQPSTIEHYNIFDQVLIQNIIKNSTSDQVHPYRGLYISLNHIQMQQILFDNSVTKYRQQRIKQYLLSIISTYSNLKITKQPILLMQNVLQNYINLQFKLFSNLQKKNQLHLINFGQYNHYAKQLFLVNSTLCDYYQKILAHIVQDRINKYQNICTQIQLLCKGNTWIGNGSNNRLNQLSRIENKVWLGKKLQTLNEYRKNLINKQIITQYLQFPIKLISQTISTNYMYKKLINSSQLQIIDSCKIIKQTKQFRQYLQYINLLNSKLLILNWNLHQKYRLNNKIHSLQQLILILPNINSKILINHQDNIIFKSIFIQQLTNKQTFNSISNIYQNQSNSQSISISYIKLKPSFISTIIQSINQSIHLFTKSKQNFQYFSKRHFFQFKSKQQSQNKKRSTNNYIYKLFNLSQPFTPQTNAFNKIIHCIPSNQFLQNQRVSKILSLIQTRLLLFGCELTPQQLINFRMLLNNKGYNFLVFWKDQTSNIIQAKQFVKLKSFRLQAKQLLDRYKDQYITFTNLKLKYKTLVQKLNQIQINNQLQDSIYLLVNCLYYLGLDNHIKNNNLSQNNYFQQFSFIYHFGNQQQKPDIIKSFFNNILKQKVCIKSILNNFSFSSFSKILWENDPSSSKYNQFRQFQQRNKYVRFHINNLKRKHQLQIKNQLLHFKFQKFIFSNILKNCSIQTYSHKLSLQIFAKNFRQKLFENSIYLTQTQKQIFDISPQTAQSKSKLQLLKDQAFQSVYFIKYYEKIFINKMYQISQSILTQQLELKKVLGDSFQQRQLNKDNKIISQSLNKVLAPKIMLNPFLNSPLLLDNYFFAGSLKLSYIDQFLNRLKNRAIMIQLAEGGFGFLLKVNELDQIVNALCKGIISFSQKEFSDRLRTYFEYTDQLQQTLLKTKKQNQNLKLLNKLHNFYDEKQIKSFLYQKLHSYIECITEKQKTYKDLFIGYKNLQNNIMKQCAQKYEQKIKELQKQNSYLRRTFKDFEQKLKHSALSNVNESRDKLYNQFKEKMQKVLNKQFIPQYENLQKISFDKKQQYQSEILLNKLKQQNIVSRLRNNVMNTQYDKKIQQLQRKLQQKQELIKDLIQQKQKNSYLMNEVNFLSNKAIQVQALQKQRKLDLQDRMIQKFKFIRINQSLQGKLSRIQNNKSKQQENKQLNSKQFNNRYQDKQLNNKYQNKQYRKQHSKYKNNILIKQKQQFLQNQPLKTQQSIFITKQNKKRSHTQFSINTPSHHKLQNNSLKNKIRTKSILTKPQSNTPIHNNNKQPHNNIQPYTHIPLHTQYQINKNKNIDQPRIWRQRWQKSQSKYQQIIQQIKIIGQNYKISKNHKKLSQKFISLMDQINCQYSNNKSLPKKILLNQLL